MFAAGQGYKHVSVICLKGTKRYSKTKQKNKSKSLIN